MPVRAYGESRNVSSTIHARDENKYGADEYLQHNNENVPTGMHGCNVNNHMLHKNIADNLNKSGIVDFIEWNDDTYERSFIQTVVLWFYVFNFFPSS